jgi:hypothetical protein
MFHFTCTSAKHTMRLMFTLSWTMAVSGESRPPADTAELLQRIRSRVAAHLAQLPNCTCHEVIDRSVKRARSSSFDYVDRVELEVAFVGNKELFAQPGQSQFEERSITSFVRSGTIGNGAFGTHAHAIFSSDAASFGYAGTTKKDGHAAIRYDFTVPQEKSSFLLKHGGAQGIIGYKGSFWVDANTLDLVRIEVKADHIPQYIGVSAVLITLRYSTIKIGNSEYLLPRSSQLAVFDELGDYSVDMINLEHCKEFTGESNITYGAPTSEGSAARSKSQE